MKLKQKPEDFIVEEINHFKVSKHKDKYKLYLVEKHGLESFAFLRYLSYKNNIPNAVLSIAGLKDKHAVSRQYMTIPSEYEIKTLEEKNFSISFVGYLREPIKSGDLIGNKFTITVRDLKKGDLEGIRKRAETVPLLGVPNYFDSQRFGSVIGNEFIAKHVLRKDYESAVKALLTKYTRFEKSSVKKEKRLILEGWNNLSSIKVKNRLYSNILEEYKQTGSWLKTYRKIPSDLREMFISAYQSYLWNECSKEVLKSELDKSKLYNVKYAVGFLFYYKDASEDETAKLPDTFTTISHDMKPSSYELGVIRKILSKEGLKPEDFNIKASTGDFFKLYHRSFIIRPSRFKIDPPEVDDTNDKGKKKIFKIKISFELPKGSYATVVTKRIFNR